MTLWKRFQNLLMWLIFQIVIGSYAEEVQHVEEKANDSLKDGRQVGDEREIVVEAGSHFNEDQNPANTESGNSVAQEDAPKKSYASNVSSQTKKGPTKIYVPTNTSRMAHPKAVKQPVAAVAQTAAPEASNSTAPSGIDVPETNDTEDEAEGYSIYVRNLPLDVTVSQLEAEFKSYGPIKPGGVQVRSNRQQGFCFGFVEFEDVSSMHSAIQASPITIAARHAVVEMKRTTTRVSGTFERKRVKEGSLGTRSELETGSSRRERAKQRAEQWRHSRRPVPPA